MLSTPDGPFINLARLDMSKYAAKPTLAKALFEYIFHHENNIRNVRRTSASFIDSVLHFSLVFYVSARSDYEAEAHVLDLSVCLSIRLFVCMFITLLTYSGRSRHWRTWCPPPWRHHFFSDHTSHKP